MNKKVYLVPLLLILFGFLQAQAQAQATRGRESECKNRIIFLPQLHDTGLVQGPEYNTERKIAESQFRIARYLEANPKAQIFSEQMLEDVTFDRLSDETKQVSAQMKLLFPRGMPEKFVDLTGEQRQQLVSLGADGILMLTGRVPILRKVVPNVATHNLIVNQIDKGMEEQGSNSVVTREIVTKDSVPYQLITTVREQYTLKEINKFFEAYPNERSAILIFGQTHDFRRHEKLFPGRCIVIPDEFADAKVTVR